MKRAETLLLCWAGCILMILSCGMTQVIIRVGGGNCGGFGCDFGPFGLDEAINASQSGDTIFMYGQLFVNPDSPTPGGFPDTIFTIQKSIGIAGIEDASIQIISPGTKGLNLFTLAAPNIEMAGFFINRQVVNNNDQNQNVATIRFRKCFNGACFDTNNITIRAVFMTADVPFLGTDVLFENGTFDTIEIEEGTFTAATGVLINETAQLTNVKISQNRFLWAAYDNLSPFKARSNVDLRLNFWRPCPYRSAAHILPALGVQEEDDWLPYCVNEGCDTPGPIATPRNAGGFRGWTSIQDALTSTSTADPLPVYVTAPFFPIDTSQIIHRRIILTSIVGNCVEACYANGTFPVVRVRNNTAATIGFVVLGDLMSIQNLQFELEERTRLALYRQEAPYNEALFTLNRGPLAFESIAFNGIGNMDAALETALTANYSMQYDIAVGGDMDFTNIQITEGKQALLFWGPNQVGIVLERDCRLSDVLFGDQSEFGVYFAGPTFNLFMESNYFGNNSASYGMLAEKMSGLNVLRSQIIGVGTGIALSEITDTTMDCNACVAVSQFCITVQTDSSGNEANWNTFAVESSKRFSRNPDNSNTLSVSDSTNLGEVTPITRVFQQFSSPNFPYAFMGSPMFTSMEDVLSIHDSNSTTIGTQSAAQSLFVKSTYLPYSNVDCFGYRDVLSSVYSAYSNVRDGCSVHKVMWDPFDNSTLPCSKLSPIVQAIPEDSWKRTGSVESSGDDCVGSAQNRSQSLRFAIGTETERNAFICVGCDGTFAPFSNKTCDFKVDTFQEALEQVRISQLEDVTIFVNGVCYVFDEEIDVEGLTIEGCGTAILSPTEGPGVSLPTVTTEASYQLRITANFTTIQGIIFEIVGSSNVTYADDYCVVFIDGELLPIFNTTLFNNTFLQPAVDQLCTLMDTWTRVRQNVFRDARISVKMSADSNAIVPHVDGVNRYNDNDFKNGQIHIFYGFIMPIRRPTQPYSRLQVVDNVFVNPGDVSLDILGINGRRSRQDLLFLRNHYTNPTPDPAACDEGNMDPDICCEDDKGCDTYAQRFVDSEDAVFDNERYFGGATMQMAGRNVIVRNSKWRDRSSATVGNTDIALLQNPFSPQNVSMENVEFNPEATLVCNLGRSFNPVTKQESALHLRDSIINGQNIGVTKDTCEQTMIGLQATNCLDRSGRTIFSARNTAPFAADEFIDPDTRVRSSCTSPFVYIPSQQGGTGTCNCEYLPDDQFIQIVPFVTVTPTPSAAAATVAHMLRQVHQTEVNSEVRNCPTGQIHNPNNLNECISTSTTPTPTPTASPTPTATPTTTTTKTRHHSSSSSSSSSDLHHLWWLWIILGVVLLAVIAAVLIWVCVVWSRKGKKNKEKEEEEEELSTMFRTPLPQQQQQQTQSRVQQRNVNAFGDSLRFDGREQELIM